MVRAYAWHSHVDKGKHDIHRPENWNSLVVDQIKVETETCFLEEELAPGL